MQEPEKIKIYTDKESFLDHPYEDFYISSYQDREPEQLNRVEPHRHTYFEIIWVQCGTGKHIIDFRDYDFEGPCLFLLHPQNIHTIQKDCPTAGGVIKFTRSIFSARELESDFILQYGVFDDIDVLPVLQLTPGQSEEIGKLFDDIHKEYSSHTPFVPKILVSYLRIFLLKIYAIKKNNLPGDLSKSPEILRFRRFQQLLENNFKKRHEPSFYAGELKISGKTLGNMTRQISDSSPSQLIRQRILLEAKRLLHHSELSVKEIAYELGFTESSYFTRFFKQNTKTSPLLYKKNNPDP